MTTASPLMTTAALILASFLMILIGSAKKRVIMKTSICPVCHRERKRCTCRWL
jgi:hypothetical protein